jgi:hypothetical protein
VVRAPGENRVDDAPPEAVGDLGARRGGADRQAGAGAEACGSTGQGGGERVGLVKLAKAAARAPPRRFQVADA